MAISYLRGHKIVAALGGEWRYVDDNTPTLDNPRPCGNCGKERTEDDHDGCLGVLPGVINACCGHGVEDEAYVQFPSGKTINGKEAIEYINQRRKP